jgi:1-acyl-sn-glycerol-3-phosphate acyltransferase
MIWLQRIYTFYVFIVFVVLFLLFFPVFLVPIAFPKAHALTGWANRMWAYVFFTLIGMPWKLEYRQPLRKDLPHVFCPNHFSYFDIPVMGLNKYNTIFVGKSAMEKIPLFGYMYRKLHITVNRESVKSRYSTLIRSLKAVDEGKSLVIFGEGGIISREMPHLARFKDGPFRVAIEKQIPLVPVTIVNNWIILPDHSVVPLLKWGRPHVIYHPPIHTLGYTLNDLDRLKEQTFSIIQEELYRHFPHKMPNPQKV